MSPGKKTQNGGRHRGPPGVHRRSLTDGMVHRNELTENIWPSSREKRLTLRYISLHYVTQTVESTPSVRSAGGSVVKPGIGCQTLIRVTLAGPQNGGRL